MPQRIPRSTPRPIRSAIVAWAVLLFTPGALFAIDPAKLPAEAVRSESISAEAFLKRLENVEKTLVRQHAPPLFSKRPAVIPLTESPKLFSTNVFGAPGTPYLGVVVQLLNNTTTEKTLVPDAVTLVADGKRLGFRDVPESIRGFVVEIGDRNVAISDAIPTGPIALPPGKVTSVLMVFAPVEARGVVPPLSLRFEFSGEVVELDLNRLHRAMLDCEAVRLGPEGACGLLTINGALDGINAGEFAGLVNSFSQAGVRRFVVAWGQHAPAPSQTLAGWLASMAVDGEMSALYRSLPALPTNVAELHFARLPKLLVRDFLDESRAEMHADVEDAIASSLWAPYRNATRATVIRELETGDPRGRAAALACGAHAFREGDLPRLLRSVDDPIASVRDSACRAIALNDSAAARNSLVRIVRTGSPRAAEAALTAILQAKSASNVAAGVTAARGPTTISELALLRILIGSHHPAFQDQIRQAARTASTDARLLALSAIGASRFTSASAVFEEAFVSPDQRIRDAALLAAAARLDLGDHQMRGIVIAEGLKRLRANPRDERAREIALKTRDPRFVPILVQSLTTGSTNATDKSAMIELLGNIGGSTAIEALIVQFHSFEPAQQALALEKIWYGDPNRAVPLAETLVGSNEPHLSQQAGKVLTQDASDPAVAAIRGAIRLQGGVNNEHLLESLALIGSPAAFEALCDVRDTASDGVRLQTLLVLRSYWSRSPASEAATRGGQALIQNTPSSEADVVEALRLLNLAIEIDPLLPDAYCGRGNVRLRQASWKEAAQDFEAALELNPFDEISLSGLALSWIMQGREEEALRWLNEGAAKFPNNINYTYNMACAYSRALEVRLLQPGSPERDKVVTELRDAAFAHLNRALELGFGKVELREPELLEKDPDLQALHDDPRFDAAVKKVKAIAD